MLGEIGTEQFEIKTIVDGEIISIQPIHDPFIRTTVVLQISRWSHFLAIFRPPKTKVQVVVDATPGAQQAIMMLNPLELQEKTKEILCAREFARNSSPVIDFEVGGN